ncbi:glycosyltransferase 61 family protein [Sphingomonas sp. Leaf38]|uniref:glycosyltransferase 61 family protein n=1 Tax=Sphingomonas sp. Leaf38 TaxID=1736217 RepID=UPI0009E6F45B|nr:glycosyltransferase 61 family protein [Sphingomonas sp. Leaf38]
MIESRKDVFVSRFERSWVGGPDHSQIPAHGRIQDATGFLDKFTPPSVQKIIRIETGTFLYGGPMKVHFGHLLVDSVIRLWAFDPQVHKQVVFAKLQETKEPTDWIYEILRLFGVERHHIRLVRHTGVFENMEFAVPGSRLGIGPSASYLEYLKNMPLERISDTPKKVYFGRIHMVAKGTVIGESYFANTLEENGYVYLKPETMNIHLQTSILRNAETIVFMEGSSIYSIELLTSVDAKIYMIPRRNGTTQLFEPHVSPRASFSVLGDPAMIVRRTNVRGKGGPSSPSYLLKPEALHQDMISKGIITGPFSLSAYEQAERADAYEYFGGDEKFADLQLNEICAARRAL